MALPDFRPLLGKILVKVAYVQLSVNLLQKVLPDMVQSFRRFNDASWAFVVLA